jgi:hypothetical protein
MPLMALATRNENAPRRRKTARPSRAQGEGFQPAAIHNLPPALTVERQRNQVMKPIPEDPLGQLAATKQLIHIFDARIATAYQQGFKPFVALVDDGGARNAVGGADTQGRQINRRICNIPPRDPSLQRQADRAGQEFRRPSGDRHREHAAAQ